MYPCYEGKFADNIKMWKCSGILAENVINGEVIDFGLRAHYTELTTIEELPFLVPKNDKKINFAILCSLYVVMNPTYKSWAINYLKGNDTSKETALKVSNKIMEDSMAENMLPLYQKIDSAYGVLSAVISDDPSLFVACAAHRSYYNSLALKTPLDLDQTIAIVENVTGKDIAEMMES